ncbi:hypothetical protein [Amycolatopsis jejuensis]|uniref:hypothetical protein n=1 Tax=Amycolatopsis jejuensis TaxID=330084 RepID=UPI0005242655|nr:hypothetical protein [Amycolatopsis jejuensis]
MTALTVIGAAAGLIVLVLMSLAPVIVELNERYPVRPRKQPVRRAAEALSTPPVRVAVPTADQGATLAAA